MIENILGSKINIRIIKFLINYPNREFSTSEIEKFARARGGNLNRSLRKLTICSVLIKQGKLYKINYSNSIIQSLIKIFEKEKNVFQNIDEKELNILSDFTNELLKKYSDIKEIILFGSVARGMYSEKSDLDLMVIKEKISQKIELEITNLIKKYERKIQCFLHTPKEFKNSEEQLFKEVKKEGIIITKLF